MTHSDDLERWFRRRRTLSAALIWAVLFIDAHTARAGINVWTSHGPPGGNVSALAVDPVTPSTLYAATDGGVFKSINGGTSWSPADAGLTGFVKALVIDPITPSTLYAGTLGGVFKSTDAGATWVAGNAGLPDTGVSALAIESIAPGTLYAGMFGDGVFKSTDSANSWQVTGLPATGLSPPNAVHALAIDPATPGTLYAGRTYSCKFSCPSGVFKSTDGASSWQDTGLPQTTYQALAIDPTMSSTLYAGGIVMGVLKSTDGGGSWQAVNAGLSNTTVLAVAIDPITPSTLYVGTEDGVFKSTDGATIWQALNSGLPDSSIVRVLTIDPTTPSRVYAGTDDGVFSIEQVGSCTGDCDMDGDVRVNELVTLMNIGLGNAPASACPHGVPDGAAVDIGLIVGAVDNGLHGCGVGG